MDNSVVFTQGLMPQCSKVSLRFFLQFFLEIFEVLMLVYTHNVGFCQAKEGNTKFIGSVTQKN